MATAEGATEVDGGRVEARSSPSNAASSGCGCCALVSVSSSSRSLSGGCMVMRSPMAWANRLCTNARANAVSDLSREGLGRASRTYSSRPLPRSMSLVLWCSGPRLPRGAGSSVWSRCERQQPRRGPARAERASASTGESSRLSVELSSVSQVANVGEEEESCPPTTRNLSSRFLQKSCVLRRSLEQMSSPIRSSVAATTSASFRSAAWFTRAPGRCHAPPHIGPVSLH